MKDIITISVGNDRIRGRVKQANGIEYSKRVVLPKEAGIYASHILLIPECFCKPDPKQEGYTLLYFYADRELALSKCVTNKKGGIEYYKVTTTPQKLADAFDGVYVNKNINYSDEYVKNLKENINVLDFIQERTGYSFRRQGSNYYRCEQHDSFVIDMNKNCFYWNSEGKSGDAIKFLTGIEKLSFRKAIEELDKYYRNLPEEKREFKYEAEERKPFVLPEKANTNYKIKDYLINQRGCDEELINKLISQGLLYQDKNGMAVFACRNWKGEIDAAFTRSTYSSFKNTQESSNPFTGYFLEVCPGATKLVLTESYIDAISYYSMAKELNKPIDFNVLGSDSCNCISETFRINYLTRPEIHDYIDTVIIASDNDKAGRQVYDKFVEKYQPFFTRIKNYTSDIPESKDWNQDLINYKDNRKEKDKTIY